MNTLNAVFRAPFVTPFAVALVLAAAHPVHAQDSTAASDLAGQAKVEPAQANAPSFQPLAYDDDFTIYAHPDLRTSAWSTLKYIPLVGEAYLTLGGEARIRSEYRQHLNFGNGAEDSGFDWQHRLLLSADLHLTPHLRGFMQLQATSTHGEDVATNAVDQNRAEVHQAFADLTLPLADGSFLLRAGRQEVTFGKARLFDLRNGPATRRAFDAVRMDVSNGPWTFGVLGGWPVKDTLGWFNDPRNRDYPFVAAHVARKLDPLLPGGNIELFYIHTDRKSAPLAVYQARRDTVSARVFGAVPRFNYDLQLVGQHGRTDEGKRIRAWYVGLDAAYQLPGAWKPTLGLRLDVGSGTKRPNGSTEGTYDFLWSRGQAYSPEFGYSNLAQVGPSISLSPSRAFTVTLQETGLWRVTKNDAVYFMTNRTISESDPTASDAHSVGLRSVLKGNYEINRFLSVGTFFNWVKRGAYMKDAGLSRNLFYNSVYLTARF